MTIHIKDHNLTGPRWGGARERKKTRAKYTPGYWATGNAEERGILVFLFFKN